MWHEYPIQSNYEQQKQIIRALRTFIERLESENLITGYCFDHYSSNPNEPDELRIRFQYANEDNRQEVENQLQTEVRRLLPDYVIEEQQWGNDTTDRHVLQAYEFGSRCAFLCWRLIENGRLSDTYLANALAGTNDKGLIFRRIPLEFQEHFNHGVMNSLGILKEPTEKIIHINNLIDVSQCKSKKELIGTELERLS